MAEIDLSMARSLHTIPAIVISSVGPQLEDGYAGGWTEALVHDLLTVRLQNSVLPSVKQDLLNRVVRQLDKPLQRILGGFIRMHVLHHAAEGDLCGNWMIEELRHHGYKISAGTLYPMLRAMEKDGWIAGRADSKGGRRRFYRITPRGRTALKEARARLRELFDETAR